jgi:hypothetical protein
MTIIVGTDGTDYGTAAVDWPPRKHSGSTRSGPSVCSCCTTRNARS